VVHIPHGTQPCTADEALARLVAGNERFVRGEARFPTVQKEILAELARGQQPYATILGCSDSRVPPELVFDAGFGELFIVRVAGNVISAEIMGTLQYAGLHLHTPLFVVLGHEGCGAVEAALAAREPGAVQPARIAVLLRSILPGLEAIDTSQAPDAQLRETPEGRARMAEGTMKVVGAIYDLQSGRVRFLP
jgi:carbonic anhydrase